MTDGHSDAGLCTIPVSALVKLLAASGCCQTCQSVSDTRACCAALGGKTGNVAQPPPYVLLSLTIQGENQADCAQFACGLSTCM